MALTFYSQVWVSIDGRLQKQTCSAVLLTSVNRPDRIRVTAYIPSTGLEFDPLAAREAKSLHDVALILVPRYGDAGNTIFALRGAVTTVELGTVPEDGDEPIAAAKDNDLSRVRFTFERVKSLRGDDDE